eukprot:3832431-Prymnesium_polylepis.3
MWVSCSSAGRSTARRLPAGSGSPGESQPLRQRESKDVSQRACSVTRFGNTSERTGSQRRQHVWPRGRARPPGPKSTAAFRRRAHAPRVSVAARGDSLRAAPAPTRR